ncbi:MAG: hypothetical protein WC763_04365 [Candidatus Paceibacterota bacterium]|jgi:hypothetical protein
MKKTSGIPSFGVHFRSLHRAIEISKEQARSSHEAAMNALNAQLKLVNQHIDQGGTLTENQFEKVPEPARTLFKAKILAKDPSIKQAGSEIKATFAEAAAKLRETLRKFSESFGKGL